MTERAEGRNSQERRPDSHGKGPTRRVFGKIGLGAVASLGIGTYLAENQPAPGQEEFADRGRSLWNVVRGQIEHSQHPSIGPELAREVRADWLHYYQQPKEHAKLIKVLERRQELPNYKEMFKSKGVDPDAFYLGIVESWFDDSAVSKAGAVGAFQFTATTAREHGLIVPNEKKDQPDIDYRSDFAKSAEACAAYLSELQTTFHCEKPEDDLLLALSCYNGSYAAQYRDRENAGNVPISYEGFLRFMQDRMQDKLNELEHERPYQVKKDDTLAKIAAHYGVTVHDLVRLNHLNAKRPHINEGQTLMLPPAPRIDDRANSKLALDVRMRAIGGYLENLNYPLKWRAVVRVISELDTQR